MESLHMHREISVSSSCPQATHIAAPSMSTDKMFHSLPTLGYLGDGFRPVAAVDELVNQYLTGPHVIQTSNGTGQVSRSSQETAEALISLQNSAFRSLTPLTHAHSYFPFYESQRSVYSGRLLPSTFDPLSSLAPFPSPPMFYSSGFPIMPSGSADRFGKPISSGMPNYQLPLTPLPSRRRSAEGDIDGPKNCHICKKTYARLSTLKLHLRTHSGEKPFKCMVCLKSFSQAANLTAHFRIHSGEKPFKCRVCGRQFSQSSSVTTHMRTHNGERPYKCKVCSKAFADSSTLTKHLRTHTGEKPYQCNICHQRFSQSGNLNRHKRIHGDDE